MQELSSPLPRKSAQDRRIFIWGVDENRTDVSIHSGSLFGLMWQKIAHVESADFGNQYFTNSY